ncbi:MAG: N-glycosylase/DNA lyase [Thermoplasmata archaeon]|nr:N-glycosylase/DNA lyase [Thermoplasmata archaeon]
MSDIEELRSAYKGRKDVIENRLREFEKVGKGKFKVLFPELVYCLLTPQSRARNCDAAVRKLQERGLLLKGNEDKIADALSGVRFKNTKAERIVGARDLFVGEGAYDLEMILQKGTKPRVLRDWFVTNVKGLGYKESSHFLRNIGVGLDLAILDRHILKNLWEYGVIREVPQSLTKKQYLETEKKMRKFSNKIGIEMRALDLLFWSMETGEVFK